MKKPPQSAFKKLVKLEPRLAQLEQDIIEHTAQHRDTKCYCANQCWYVEPGFKERMSCLVGFSAPNSALRTMHAYDLAYDHLYNLLPDCRGCDEVCL
jgi:hypothetical protein